MDNISKSHKVKGGFIHEREEKLSADHIYMLNIYAGLFQE